MADRREIINAVLLTLVTERVKHEVGNMISAGATHAQVDDTLPSILLYYTEWQMRMLEQCLTECADLDHPFPVGDPPLTPLTRN